MTDADTLELLVAAGVDDPARAGTAARRLARAAEGLADSARDAAREAWAAHLVAELRATVPAPPPRTNVPDLPSATELPRHPAEVRRLICRLLAVVAGRTQVPDLAAALADAETREAARGAIAAVPGIPATNALVAAVRLPGTEFRVGVVRALAVRRDRGALGVLAGLAAREADPEVRLAAIDGIAHFPEQSTDALLEKLSREGGPRERARARIARRRLADTLREFGVTAAADAILRDIGPPP